MFFVGLGSSNHDFSVKNRYAHLCVLACRLNLIALLLQQQLPDSEFKDHSGKEKPTPIVDSVKEEPGWPSFGQLIIDLSKLALEALAGMLLYFVPSRFRTDRPRNGLTPLKDSLRMPEDEAKPAFVQRQTTTAPLPETRQAHAPNRSDRYSEMKPPKIKSASFKDPALSSKHRSSKRPEYADFYGSGEVPPYSKSKSQKERTRHRQRDKNEAAFEAVGAEPKPVEKKAGHYEVPKFEYNIRSKYGPDDSFRF